MELEDMKSSWAQLSSEMESQKKLTKEIILKMAHQKSSRSLGNMLRMERIGGLLMATLLILAIVVFIINGTINSFPLIICAILSMSLFSFSGYLSWNFIEKMKKINILDNTIEETQRNFDEFQKVTVLYKKVGIYSIFPTMLFFVPVVLKVFMGQDVFLNFSESKEKLIEVLITSILLSIPLLFFIFRFYKKNINATKEAIAEIVNKD